MLGFPLRSENYEVKCLRVVQTRYGDHCLDRKSTRLNSSHTEIYTLSLHDALPIFLLSGGATNAWIPSQVGKLRGQMLASGPDALWRPLFRSEEHTSELQSHRDLHSFPTRRSSDLPLERGRHQCLDSLSGRKITRSNACEWSRRVMETIV